jgi:hypothetical protein
MCRGEGLTDMQSHTGTGLAVRGIIIVMYVWLVTWSYIPYLTAGPYMAHVRTKDRPYLTYSVRTYIRPDVYPSLHTYPSILIHPYLSIHTYTYHSLTHHLCQTRRGVQCAAMTHDGPASSMDACICMYITYIPNIHDIHTYIHTYVHTTSMETHCLWN